MDSTSRSLNLPSFQPSYKSFHSRTTRQTILSCSKSAFNSSISTSVGGARSSNTTKPFSITRSRWSNCSMTSSTPAINSHDLSHARFAHAGCVCIGAKRSNFTLYSLASFSSCTIDVRSSFWNTSFVASRLDSIVSSWNLNSSNLSSMDAKRWDSVSVTSTNSFKIRKLSRGLTNDAGTESTFVCSCLSSLTCLTSSFMSLGGCSKRATLISKYLITSSISVTCVCSSLLTSSIDSCTRWMRASIALLSLTSTAFSRHKWK